MGKALGKAALLGGAALLASRMMGKKGEDKEGKKGKETPTETGAGAGMAKDKLGGIGFDRGDMDTSGDMSAGQARDRLSDLEKTTPRAPTRAAPRTAPRTASRADTSRANEIPSVSENLGASGMPREARGVTAGSPRAVDPRLGTFGSMGKNPRSANPPMFKKGGAVKSSASKRADGICKKGKTKGRMV
jgi:hypothetical protein